MALNQKTIVIGHRQPDLDSVSAALVYAEFLKSGGAKNVVAAHGDILNDETKYILKKFRLFSPRTLEVNDIQKKDQIILVDHNEESQRLENLPPNQIIEIVDHHKANLNLNQPIKIDIRPWGSTSTILYDYFLKQNQKLEKNLASLILSAILSDTLGLKGPTTTEVDRKAAQALARLTGLDLKKLTLEIFLAKSAIDNLSPEQIVSKDYKIYDFGGKKTLINQIETVDQPKVLRKAVQLFKVMEGIQVEQGIDYIFCLVTDILKKNSRLLFIDEKAQKIAERAFGGKAKQGILDIGPRVSRKKEVAPEIEKAIKKSEKVQ